MGLRGDEKLAPGVNISLPVILGGRGTSVPDICAIISVASMLVIVKRLGIGLGIN